MMSKHLEFPKLKVASGKATALGLAVLFLFAACANAVLVPRDKAKERAIADEFFTNGLIVNLKIQIAETNVASLRKDQHKVVPCTLQEGDAIYKDIAIHLKGGAGSFRPIDDKPGFTISFRAFESGTNFHGLGKFHLNNSVQDATYLSDWLCAELFRRAGVPAPRYAHALVELNGRKLGLYLIMESENGDFLSRFFKNTKGNLYGQTPICDVTDPIQRMEGKGPVDREDLKALARAAQERDLLKRWEKLKQTLDIDRFCSFIAMEVLLCDWDGYVFNRHNYRIYQDLDNGGRMIFMPHDKDQVLADMNAPFMPNSSALISASFLGTPEGRLLYRTRFGELLTNVFQPTVLTNEVGQLVAKLLPALTNYDKNLAVNFSNNANGLKQRIVNRRRGLEEQFSLPGPQIVQFTNGLAPNLPWEAYKDQVNTRMEVIGDGGKVLLHTLQNGGVSLWRTSMVLGPGNYRFSGKAKCANIQGGSGAGLGILGTSRTNKVEKTMDWTPLVHEFSLQANGEVVLTCELRGGKGEVWFDANSLQLEKLK